MSEERLGRIETRLDDLHAVVVDLRRDTREGFRQIDERFRETASQARSEYDAISQAIADVRVAAAESDDALRRDMTAGFAAVRQELTEGLASVRQELTDGLGAVRQELREGLGAARQDLTDGLAAVRQHLTEGLTSARQELAGGLKSGRSETTGLRRTMERVEDKLDRALATRPARSPGRRRR
jgi:hypothetical protein